MMHEDEKLDAFDARMMAEYGVSPFAVLEHAQSRLLASSDVSIYADEPDTDTQAAIDVLEHALNSLFREVVR